MKQSKSNTQNIKSDQSGFAAIIVTLIIVALVVLVTVGFLRVATREQRSALDRQLSTQAFYAAETGVNDATKLLLDDATASLVSSKNTCDVSDTTLWSPDLDAGVEYTCVLVEAAPENLEYGSIGTTQPKVIRINAVDEDGISVPVDSLTISWQAENMPAPPIGFSSGTSFTNQASDFSAAPVLRVSLTPLNDINRQALVENTMTFFLRPSSGGNNTGSFISGSGNVQNQGQIFETNCNPTDGQRACNFTISSMGGVSASEYLMTIRSIYGPASVLVDGTRAGGAGGIRFAGQQAIIDSTGRAGDVLRRIQVRAPLTPEFPYPGFVLEATGGICKPYSVYPNAGTNEGDAICALP